MGALKAFKSGQHETTRGVQYGDLASNRHRNRVVDDLLDTLPSALAKLKREFERKSYFEHPACPLVILARLREAFSVER